MKYQTIKALCLFFLLTGCGAYLNENVNPFYFGMTVYDSKDLKKPKNVEIYNYSENNLQYFIKQGYQIKAKSAFREQFVDISWAKLASKQIGTPIMLVKQDYAGSVAGRQVLPFVIPGEEYVITSNTNSTLDYNSNTNAYAVGSNGYAIGSSSTTGTGNYNSITKTTIKSPDKYGYKSVKYENHYYDYFAVFLVKKTEPKKKSAPKKYIRISNLKYSGSVNLKEEPDFKSETIKEVGERDEIYIIKTKVSSTNYDEVYVNGHYGYILNKLIKGI